MRNKIMLALWAGLASAGTLAAQTIPMDRVIAQDVEVRSGPGMNFYPTSKVKAGDHVRVQRALTDQPGWLEIEPPAGSYSWINTKFLTQDTKDPRQWFVKSDTPVLPGSGVEGAGRPNRETMRLPPGTIVVAVANKAELEGETWLPIKPHTGEARYIPATAVQPAATTVKTNSPATWTLTPQNMFTPDAALAAAQQREAQNDRAGAMQLYQQVLNDPNASPNSRSLASNAIARLQQPAYGSVQATTTSLSPANSAATTALNLQTYKAAEWSAYGRLRDRKMTTQDGQPLYSLEDSNDRVLTYVSTIAGKSLQSYVGRWISVYGPMMYRPDAAVTMPYVVASHISAP
jgi:uncharacterized protein YgiM (DUF1202 family)